MGRGENLKKGSFDGERGRLKAKYLKQVKWNPKNPLDKAMWEMTKREFERRKEFKKLDKRYKQGY